MSSACQSAVACVDSHLQIHHPAYANLYKWAASDAEFVRSLSAGSAGVSTAINNNNNNNNNNNKRRLDSFSCRQKFLRSYTFSKKETVPEKTAKCFGKVKERATDLPCMRRSPRNDSGEYLRVLSRGEEYYYKTSKGPKKKKGRSVFWCVFRRLLSCLSSFDVVEGNSVVHAL